MTRPDDEFPPLDVTSTLNLGALDEVLEGPDTDVVPSRVSGSLPPGMALLVVRRGPNAGARFLLDHDVTTSGRHPDSDIFLDDVTVSRRHAEFHRDGRHVHRARRGQPQRHLRQPGAGRVGHAEQRRRGADRQVPAGVHRRSARRRARRDGRDASAAAARDPAAARGRRGARVR